MKTTKWYVADFETTSYGYYLDNGYTKVWLFAVCDNEVSAPTIAECPFALECRVVEVIPMGTHDVFIADIVSVSADESIIDEAGKIRFDKAGLMAYAHGEYFALGEKLGSFGFSTKKSAPKKPLPKKNTVENKPKTAPVSKENGEKENKKHPFYIDAPRGKGTKPKGKGKRK